MGLALQQLGLVDGSLDGGIATGEALDERLEHVDTAVEAALYDLDEASCALLEHLDGFEVLYLQAERTEISESGSGCDPEGFGSVLAARPSEDHEMTRLMSRNLPRWRRKRRGYDSGCYGRPVMHVMHLILSERCRDC